MRRLIIAFSLLYGVAMQSYASKTTSAGPLSNDNYPKFIHILTEEEEEETEFLIRNCFDIAIFDDKTCRIFGGEDFAASKAESVIKKELVNFLRREGRYQGEKGPKPGRDIYITIQSEDSDYGRSEYRRIEAIVIRILTQEHSLSPSLKISLRNHMAWGYPPPPPPPPLVDVIEEVTIDENDVIIED